MFGRLSLGHLDQAVEEGKRALKLDPLSPIINADFAWTYFCARRFDKAERQARKTLEIDPQFFDRFATEPLDELPEWKTSDTTHADAFAKEFDAQLNGRTAKLLDYSANAPAVIASSYRSVLGLSAANCPDAEAIDAIPRSGKHRS